METCFRCGKNGKEVKLLDAIYENEMVKICERCSVGEDIPVLRKPSTSQLRESEKAYGVYQRMRRLAGLVKEEKKTESVLDQLKRLEENPELEMPEEKKPLELIDNFHWHVQRARRNKGLSQKQLGWALGESEAAISLIEKAQLPEDSEKLLRKLEQFLQITITKKTEEEIEEEKRQKERTQGRFKTRFLEEEQKEKTEEEIENEGGIEVNELELISSLAGGKVAGEAIEKGEEELTPLEVLSFKPEIAKKVTIEELKKMREAHKEEMLKKEEEERKSLQEKRKQELREEVAGEMKGLALGKTTKVVEKRAMRIEKTNHIPTIAELAERKREREKMTGDEIELEE